MLALRLNPTQSMHAPRLAFEKASGKPIPYEIAPRRPGDIAASYADPTRANADLNWHATKTIDDMCVDTWRWQSENPTGYPDA